MRLTFCAVGILLAAALVARVAGEECGNVILKEGSAASYNGNAEGCWRSGGANPGDFVNVQYACYEMVDEEEGNEEEDWVGEGVCLPSTGGIIRDLVLCGPTSQGENAMDENPQNCPNFDKTTTPHEYVQRTVGYGTNEEADCFEITIDMAEHGADCTTTTMATTTTTTTTTTTIATTTIDPCAGTDCGNGSCIDGTCVCASGWDGANCQTAKQCTAGANGQACTNGGAVKGTTGNCGCSCVSGWDGANCQTAKQCTAGANDQACANGGAATGTTGNCGCSCAGGWDGANCETAEPTPQPTPAPPQPPPPPAATRSTTTTTTAATTTTTATTTTIYDPGNVDCRESQDDCTAACQTSANRNYVVTAQPQQKGRACAGPAHCQPGDGACPTTATTPPRTTAAPPTAPSTAVTAAGMPTLQSTAEPPTTDLVPTTTVLPALGVNAKCDPRADACDISKELYCNAEFYECRYVTTTTSSSPPTSPSPTTAAATTTSTPNTLVGTSSQTSIGGTVAAIVGAVVALTIGICVGRQCFKPSHEVVARAGAMGRAEANVVEPYGNGVTTTNPTFNTEALYESADPNRVKVYDDGFIAGSADHALRDVRRQSQALAEEDPAYATVA